MKAAYKKEKGRKLELKVAKALRKVDKKAGRMPGSGSFRHFKSDINTKLPYFIECKNQERVQIWKWWDQTTSNPSMYKKPVLIFTSNHRPILVTMELDDWVDQIKELHEMNQKKSLKTITKNKKNND